MCSRKNDMSELTELGFCRFCQSLIREILNDKVNSTWMDSKGAADYIKVSEKQLRNLVASGHIKYHKLLSLNRYKKEELDRFLNREQRGGWFYGDKEGSENR